MYDLTERVLPPAILGLPTPDRASAHRGLIDRAARALGVATESDLRDYFRTGVAASRTAIAELADQGVLQRVAVEGWKQPAWLHHEARRPRRIGGRALLAPFDPLIWERARTERLFGFHYRIEIYTPAAKRRHGYYVLPFLLGDRLVARVDLKADRRSSVLQVPAVHFEPGASTATHNELHGALQEMSEWLNLDEVEYNRRGYIS